MADGVAMLSLFQFDAQPPSHEPSKIALQLPGSGLIEYDHAANVLNINLPGSIEINTPEVPNRSAVTGNSCPFDWI